ncbi:Sortase A, LPXTG specific [Streptococcus sp. DD13]|nr:Sortase A, LPXTG specific [Streptococcus sp. DD13]
MLLAWNTNKYIVSEISEEELKKNQSASTTFDFDQVESISSEKVLAAQWNAQELPVIGGVAIPDINLNLPIFKGLSNVALMYGAGTMKEDQKMGEGNYALASHHVFNIAGSTEMLFSPLDRAKVGMNIYITDKSKVYTYVITEVTVVEPTAVQVIDDEPGKKLITLVTCDDPGATKRTIVKGELVESKTEDYSKANSKTLSYFAKKYNQIQL